MNGGEQRIRRLREGLVRVAREGRRELLDEVVDGVRDLGEVGYRCCLVNFGTCRPAYYVRILGFEDARVKAELEFPIDPRLDPVQRVPLSHLADYGEAEKPRVIRLIYDGMAEFVHTEMPPLSRRPPVAHSNPRAGHSRRRLPRDIRRRRVRRATLVMAAGWGAAGTLFTCGLLAFLAL